MWPNSASSDSMPGRLMCSSDGRSHHSSTRSPDMDVAIGLRPGHLWTFGHILSCVRAASPISKQHPVTALPSVCHPGQGENPRFHTTLMRNARFGTDECVPRPVSRLLQTLANRLAYVSGWPTKAVLRGQGFERTRVARVCVRLQMSGDILENN